MFFRSKPLIDEAVAKNLCPGESRTENQNFRVNFNLVAAVDVSTIPDGPRGHGTHAMVLVTVKDGKLIFKNTYVKNKQVTIPVEKGPLEFYFVQLELTRDGLRKLPYSLVTYY